MPSAQELHDAALVPDMDGMVFCIGTFARRVNFLAQQRRALNLVWALNELKVINPTKSVAVVGGGLAGVTAAGALMGFGVKVDLFEAGRRVLHLQRETSHRRAHPSINSWPHETMRLDAELPFFDWATGLCSEVAEEIAREFEQLMKQEGNQIYTKNPVQDIISTGAGVVRIVSQEKSKNDSFDLVIVTTGFGREVNLTDFPCQSYWRGDNLEPERDDVSEDFVVSGCGDGGLIDALRLIHFNFDKGRLAFSIARRLSGTELADAIKLAEDIARAGGKIADLATAYEAAALEIKSNPAYKDINAQLVDSAAQFNRVVYLSDNNLEKPYSISAAPVHKLLIAHAHKVLAKISYKKTKIKKSEFGEVLFSDRKLGAPPKTKVVIRHGAEPSLRNLLPSAYDKLEEKQKVLSDSFADAAWPASFCYPVSVFLPAFDRSSQKFAWSKIKQAQRALSEIFDDVSVQPTPGRLRAQITQDKPEDAPTRLFQLEVVYEPVLQSDKL